MDEHAGAVGVWRERDDAWGDGLGAWADGGEEGRRD